MPEPAVLAGLTLPPELPCRPRAARDQALILDPRAAPRLLPLLTADLVFDFACDEPPDWLVVIDHADPVVPDWQEWLAGQAGLRRFLRDGGWPLERPATIAWRPFAAAALPWLIATPDGRCVALSATRCVVSAPLLVVPAADDLLLALATTAVGRSRLAAGSLWQPQLTAAQDAELRRVAGAARALQRERLQLQRGFAQRLLADFAPPGVGRIADFLDWPQLSFSALAERVAHDLRNPIPSRFVPIWQQRFAQAQQELHRLGVELQRLADLIEAAAS